MPNARVSAAGGAVSAPTVILEFTPAMRALVENLVEDLIALLDVVDGPEDDEDSADEEPTLGFLDQRPNQLQRWEGDRAYRALDGDLEDDDPREEDDPAEDNGDVEPSLCGLSVEMRGGDDDREGDPAELGIADEDALNLVNGELEIQQIMGRAFDGSGKRKAWDLMGTRLRCTGLGWSFRPMPLQ